MITADLPLHAIGENNPLPNSCTKASTTRKGARKLAIESHYSIMAEIFRREALADVDSADNTDSCDGTSTSTSSSSSSSAVKAAAAVIGNKITIPLICEHHLFCEQTQAIKYLRASSCFFMCFH